MPTTHDIAEKVQYRLHELESEISFVVDEAGITEDHGWWYVPVRPSVQPVKRTHYYDALAQAQGSLMVDDDLNVFLVPAYLESE